MQPEELYKYCTLYSQRDHSDCHKESACRLPNYSPTKIKLESPAAIEAYRSKLMSTLIYKKADSYCRVRIYVNHSFQIILVILCSVETHTG